MSTQRFTGFDGWMRRVEKRLQGLERGQVGQPRFLRSAVHGVTPTQPIQSSAEDVIINWQLYDQVDVPYGTSGGNNGFFHLNRPGYWMAHLRVSTQYSPSTGQRWFCAIWGPDQTTGANANTPNRNSFGPGENNQAVSALLYANGVDSRVVFRWYQDSGSNQNYSAGMAIRYLGPS